MTTRSPEGGRQLISSKQWSTKKSLLAQVQKLWDSGLLLQELSLCLQQQDTAFFPKRLVFKSPNSKALASEFDAVRGWITEVKKATGFHIIDKTVNHRVIGENSLPAEAWLSNLDAAIELLNKPKEAAAYSGLFTLTQQRSPQLIPWLCQYPLKALSLVDAWPKLLDFIHWRQQHPDPQVYLRQVSLPGIDSKFIEQHRNTLTSLLDLSLPAEQVQVEMTGVKRFELRYGFRAKPERIRFRLLDDNLGELFAAPAGADNDLSVTADDFNVLGQKAGFSEQVKRVFITENEINFLSFPPQKNSLLIFGSGYGFDALAQAGWLSDMAIYYWGDIDTHGFAILDQLRSKFPHVRSLMMDERTLMAHADFWGEEDSQTTNTLSRLTAEESSLLQSLLSHTHKKQLRLEQERIQFDYLTEVLFTFS